MKRLKLIKLPFILALISVLLIQSSYINTNSSNNVDLKSSNNSDTNNIMKIADTKLENLKKQGNKTNVFELLEIDLPDSSWNITEIQFNFSNIKQYRQTRTIEDDITDKETFGIYFDDDTGDGHDGSGFQLKILEPTTIYGLYLYGNKSVTTTEPLFIEIRGFEYDFWLDPIINRSVHVIQLINMSYTERWYYQDFSANPVQLTLNNYYLYLDGLFIYDDSTNYTFGWQDSSNDYYWYDQYWDDWDGDYYVGEYGPLLCKIVEKVNRTYYPENIKMNATINENDYTIKNCTTIGDGNLTITNINFFPGTNKLIVPITNINKTEELIYNLSYSIMLQKVITFFTITIESGEDDDDEKSSTKTGIDPLVYFFTIIGLIIIVIAALTSYYSIKTVKRKKEHYRKKIFNKYMDVANLNHIFVKEKKTGLNFYEQTITGKNIDLSLISGFLDAVKSFGIELTGSEEKSQTIKLEYQNSQILMSEFKNLRIVNIMEELPSKDFVDSINPLALDIDKYYGKYLEDFDGEVTKFQGIKDLIEEHLQISLIYPLKVTYSKESKLNLKEKAIVNQALDIMKQNNSKYFYVSQLMTKKEFNPRKAEKILKLINKKIFQPVI